MNKYQTWYQNITDRARDRTLEGYVERHHVSYHEVLVVQMIQAILLV
jgi:hypothetical protein